MLPLGVEEMHRRTGKAKEKRRQSTKIYIDLCFVMRGITTRVEEAGRMKEEIMLLAVDTLFEFIAGAFFRG